MLRSVLVLPFLSPIVLCVCKRKNAKHQVPLCYCNTTLGGRQCIVGLEWIGHWWLLGTHHATRICWQGHNLFSRSSITMICLMLISSIIFTFGFILKTLVDLCFMPNDVHEARKWSCGTALWLSLQVYNVDIKPGLIPKILSILQIFYLAHTSFSVCILLIALGPYVSMGIVACLGQLPAI